MKYLDNIKNFIDTKIDDLHARNTLTTNKMPKGHFNINSKTVNVKTWWRHRNSDGFTIHEKKAFDDYLELKGIDWSKYDKTLA